MASGASMQYFFGENIVVEAHFKILGHRYLDAIDALAMCDEDDEGNPTPDMVAVMSSLCTEWASKCMNCNEWQPFAVAPLYSITKSPEQFHFGITSRVETDKSVEFVRFTKPVVVFKGESWSIEEVKHVAEAFERVLAPRLEPHGCMANFDVRVNFLHVQ